MPSIKTTAADDAMVNLCNLMALILKQLQKVLSYLVVRILGAARTPFFVPEAAPPYYNSSGEWASG
jgi:hypothetical protein